MRSADSNVLPLVKGFSDDGTGHTHTTFVLVPLARSQAHIPSSFQLAVACSGTSDDHRSHKFCTVHDLDYLFFLKKQVETTCTVWI